jgi:hypothetical protein
MSIFLDLLDKNKVVYDTDINNFITETMFNCIMSKLIARLPFIIENYNVLNIKQQYIIKSYLNNFRFKNKNKLMSIALLKISFIFKCFLMESKWIYMSTKNKKRYEYRSNFFSFSVIFDILNPNKVPQLFPPNKMGQNQYRHNL